MAPVVISVDGLPLPATTGQAVASALLAGGIRHLRDSPRGAPRGAFCLVGTCQECLFEIDGDMALACRTPVRQGQCIRLAVRAP